MIKGSDRPRRNYGRAVTLSTTYFYPCMVLVFFDTLALHVQCQPWIFCSGTKRFNFHRGCHSFAGKTTSSNNTVTKKHCRCSPGTQQYSLYMSLCWGNQGEAMARVRNGGQWWEKDNWSVDKKSDVKHGFKQLKF